MKHEEFTLLDATLRDSSYAVDFQFTKFDYKAICAGLEQAGVKMIELGHGLGLGASSEQNGYSRETDETYLATAAETLKVAKFGCFFIPHIGTTEDIVVARSLGASFIRIGCDVTHIDQAREYTDLAKAQGFLVSLNPMKSYLVSPKELATIANNADTWGSVDIFSVVDSAGSMTPIGVSDYVYECKQNSDLRIGFHGHNNLGLANANCLAAAESGASVVDATLRGMGRSAGNAQTEVIAHLLKEYRYDEQLDVPRLLKLVRETVEPLMKREQGIPPLDVLFGITKFHSSKLKQVEKISKDFGVDLETLIYALGQSQARDQEESEIESIAKSLSHGI